MRTRFTGGCFCGAIRWEAGTVFDAGYCHCSICRRTTGAPAVAFARFRLDEFRLTKGSPKSFATSESGRRLFCGDCGAGVCFLADRWPYVSVAIGTFDHPAELHPTVHQCDADRLPWFNIADDLPRFPTNEISHPDERPPPTE